MAEPKWKKKQPEYSIDFPELTLEESQERFPREGVYIYDDKIHVVQSQYYMREFNELQKRGLKDENKLRFSLTFEGYEKLRKNLRQLPSIARIQAIQDISSETKIIKKGDLVIIAVDSIYENAIESWCENRPSLPERQFWVTDIKQDTVKLFDMIYNIAALIRRGVGIPIDVQSIPEFEQVIFTVEKSKKIAAENAAKEQAKQEKAWQTVDLAGSISFAMPDYSTAYENGTSPDGMRPEFSFHKWNTKEIFGIFTNDREKYLSGKNGKKEFHEDDVEKCGFRYFVEGLLNSYVDIYKPFGDKRF